VGNALIYYIRNFKKQIIEKLLDITNFKIKFPVA